jgi:hypothetical protein
MRASSSVLVVLLTAAASGGQGQEKVVTPDVGTLAAGKGWTVHHATAEAAEAGGRRAVRLTAGGDSANGTVGLALADGVEFATGTIEVDLKGKNVRGRSFLGVAFGVAGEKTFEAVYFRPFNFRAEGEFKGRAVQYVAWPEHTWEKLRKGRPGKFEAAVSPVPDPDGWFRARVEVGEKEVRVYVDGAKEACLTVERLAGAGRGRRVGLFVDSADGLYADLKITPAK